MEPGPTCRTFVADAEPATAAQHDPSCSLGAVLGHVGISVELDHSQRDPLAKDSPGP